MQEYAGQKCGKTAGKHSATMHTHKKNTYSTLISTSFEYPYICAKKQISLTGEFPASKDVIVMFKLCLDGFICQAAAIPPGHSFLKDFRPWRGKWVLLMPSLSINTF